MAAQPIQVAALDHLVLTVRDLETTRRFYETVLGMTAEEFQPGRWALNFGRQKLNLHIAGQVIDPNVRHATPGSADLCLLTDTPMANILAHLETCGVAVIEGPVRRTGATGPIQSIYCRDPDGNLIEIANKA